MDKKRCPWASNNEYFWDYHDKEWGVPQHEDRMLFEMLCLEGAQAGVTWLIVLKKREHYKKLFCNFEAEKVVSLTDEQLEGFLLDPGIIRNRLKVYGVRKNAEAFLKVKEEFGSFDKYIWQFVGGKPIINHFASQGEVPVSTQESDLMAKDLKKRGFKFVGTTICYAFMQAVGMVDDHTTDCWRHTKEMILAPCGIDCSLCHAYQRKKNICEGCYAEDGIRVKHCESCKIKLCDGHEGKSSSLCIECEKFPCKWIKQIDLRYRKGYGVSLIQNQVRYKELGEEEFMKEEELTWTCPNCGLKLCIHRENCQHCRRKRNE